MMVLRVASMGWSDRRLAVVMLAAAGLVAAACSEEAPTGFTADNRAGFLAACSRPLDDTRLVSDICQCVFDRTQAEIEFERFSEADALLKAESEREIPPDIAGIVAECVITEADL